VATGCPEPVTVLIDRHDHPDWTAAAHAAHNPGLGCLTIDPSPANGAPAALAHDLLYALGKRLPHGGETHGTRADSQQPAFDAVAAWILTHHIGHLIVCRTDRLTTARQQQLLTLRERCGIRLTLLWHRPVTPALRTLLEQTPHHLVETLPQARGVLEQTARAPHGTPNAGRQRPLAAAPRRDDGRWISGPLPAQSTAAQRPRRAECPEAPALAPATRGTPSARGDDHTAVVLADQLATVAHPLHATALVIQAVTGADIGRLALLRGVDVNETATVVKIHDSPAHRHCRIYPLPYWARPLAHAAGIHRQLQGHAPGSTLLPLISLRDAEQLRRSAEGIRYRLRPAP
jgi:hypothetical protein